MFAASTTAGQDPTSNLMMAAYSRFLQRRGLDVPQSSLVPRPVTGQYIGTNLASGVRIADEGWDVGKQPKGYGFSGNFMGDPGVTIDKQMMEPISATEISSGRRASPHPAPPGSTYRIAEGVVSDLAAQRGIDPRDFQEVAWAGIKGSEGFPMIRHVNEAIERTAQLTGQSAEEVVRRWIMEDAPLYGVVGLFGAGTIQSQREGG